MFLYFSSRTTSNAEFIPGPMNAFLVRSYSKRKGWILVLLTRGAGPLTTFPWLLYWDPWQGQMNLFSAAFHGAQHTRGECRQHWFHTVQEFCLSPRLSRWDLPEIGRWIETVFMIIQYSCIISLFIAWIIMLRFQHRMNSDYYYQFRS